MDRRDAIGKVLKQINPDGNLRLKYDYQKEKCDGTYWRD
jgi:hypothetical protein